MNNEEEEGEYRLQDEEEEDEEESESKIREIGNHPLMERIQKTLYDQLIKEKRRLEAELRERQEDLKRDAKEREQIGVELYNVQQELAKLQNQSEELLNKRASAEEQRISSEQKRVELRKDLASAKGVRAEEEERLSKHQSELDNVNATLRQVELYNEEMKGEVAIARRATYRAEQQVTDAERKKRYQDLYIQNLNEQVKTLRDRVGLYESQIKAQREETNEAKKTMSEAVVEMEAIAFEKRQLMQQWKSSLIGIRQRDEALQATRDTLEEQKKQITAVVSETKGVRRSIQELVVDHERVNETRENIESEIVRLKQNTEKYAADYVKLEERYEMLRHSLNQTDSEVKRVALQKKSAAEQSSILDQNYEVVERERQSLETEISNCKNTKTTVSKAAQNLNKMAGKIQQKLHKMEHEIVNVENEMSRIKIDRLHTDTHNQQLSSDLAKLEKELKDKDRMIEKYDQEIRKRNDEAEKKMYVVDRLNRKFERLTKDKKGDENHGPLEATIHNLQNTIVKRKEDNRMEQRDWLKMQRRLVDVVSKSEDLKEEIHNDVSKVTVLQQQRLRLDSKIVANSKDLSDLKKSVEKTHGEMKRLNRLIAANKDLQAKLASTTVVMEKEFKAELREMEMESIRMDRKNENLKQEQERILEDIMEIERQILLWEKKIKLEKETQEALDPEVGMAEARSMENEIHRMKLRYNALKREQENMLKEIEMAIQKREAIAVRNRGQKKSKTLSKSAVKVEIRELDKIHRNNQKKTKKCESEINQMSQELKSLESNLNENISEQQRVEKIAHELQQDMNERLYMKQKIVDSTALLKQMRDEYLKFLKQDEDDEDDYSGSKRKELVEDGTRESRREEILELIETLKSEFPQFKDVLSRVGGMSNQALPI